MAEKKKQSGAGDAGTQGAKTNAPNVKLAAKAEPLGAGAVTVGETVLCELPGEDEQRAGFYCEAAEQLVRVYPRFKLIKQL